MLRNTRSQSLNRKRTVQEANLNLTSEKQPKQRKFIEKNKDKNMENPNGEFIDLSSTINARTAPNNNKGENATGSSRAVANSGTGTNVDPEISELVAIQNAIEERMKGMIQHEMNEMKKSIMELSKTVKEISVTRSQFQESVDSRQNQRIQNGNDIHNNIPLNNNLNEIDYNIRNHGQNTGVFGATGNVLRNPEKINIRVDKWGLSFNGNNTHLNIEDFIFRIEHLQSHYDISWEEILRDFHLLVAGAAKDWYWLLVKTHGNLRWPTLKAELRNQYQTNISNFEIMRDLVERKQQPNESLDAFFFEMSKLRSRLMQPIPEYDMVKILKRNIKESVARIVYPIAVSSVEQLRMECQEAERNFPRKELRNNHPQQRVMRNVSELSYDDNKEDEPEMEDVAAARVMVQKQNIICWNCNLSGHTFRNCNASERSLFCYRCGKPNVIAPKCPECQKGNRMRDVGAAGDPRPAKNPN